MEELRVRNGTAKREDEVDVFIKGKFELLALTEAKFTICDTVQ